jgi:hypothetical protein
MTSVTSLHSRTCFLRNQINREFSVTITLVRVQISHVAICATQISCPSVLTEQVAGGIVVPISGRLIACLGVDDLVIVDMPDTLLVTTRARSQEVKRLVKKCKEAGWKSLL